MQDSFNVCRPQFEDSPCSITSGDRFIAHEKKDSFATFELLVTPDKRTEFTIKIAN